MTAIAVRRPPARWGSALLVALCLAGAVRVAQGAAVPLKAAVAQVLLERAFEAGVENRRARRPWPWADMAPVARLGFPRLGVTRTVIDGGSGQAMAFGPTLLPAGARPGAPGTVVIAAHRDTHFRVLADVRRGDVLTLEGLDGVTRRYRVQGGEVVRWDRFAVARDGQDTLVLATCYPFGALRHGPLRYVVRATLVLDGSRGV